MDEPKYKPNRVAAAAGVELDALRSWERPERGLIKRDGHKLFTFRRALQVAVMGALIRMGVRTELASDASYMFTDEGQGPLPNVSAGRDPGQNFSEGWTVICLYEGVAEVKNVVPTNAAAQVFVPMGHTRAEGVTLLNVTFIADRLKAALEG